MLLNNLQKSRMKKRQAGMTTLGLIILVSFVGLFAFAGIRLAPVYLNYMKIVGVVDGVRDEFDGAGASRSQIQSSISRRFDIESVGIITARDVKVTKVEGGHEVAATYSHKAPFIANVSFVVDFDKRTLVRR
jgi:CBS domain-containing protein